MRRLAITMLFVLTFGMAFAQSAPPVVGGDGVTLKGLAGTSTLVTVVLKPNGALDRNVRVVAVFDDYLNVKTSSNETIPYLFSSVQEIRVQDGEINTRDLSNNKPRALTTQQKKMVESAYDRAKQIYGAADTDQTVKMRAATLLAFNNVMESREYLKQLANCGDLETELDAALCLYLAGDPDLGGPLLEKGLRSGNSKIKAKAAQLAGLLGASALTTSLLDMANDRDIKIAGPAVRALARLENRDVIEPVFQLLIEPSEEKGEVAYFALTRLGDEKCIEQLRDKLNTTSGLIRQRVIVLLYKLGDPLGKKLLKKESMDIPSLRFETALLLAKDGDFDAKNYLVKWLTPPFNEKEEILIKRVQAAEALFIGGQPSALTVFQNLLRSDNPKINKMACQSVVAVGDLKLLPTLQPVVPQNDFDVALAGCYATIALAHDDFRERHMGSLDMTP